MAHPALGTTASMHAVAIAAAATIACATNVAVAQIDPLKPGNGASAKPAMAPTYIESLKALLTTRILPGLQRAILATATSRPSALYVEVTDDPSPYSVAARMDPDESLTVRLSVGYLRMHDAALEAVSLAAAFRRPEALQAYLKYQIRWASNSYERSARGGSALRAMSFAEFIGVDAKTVEAVLNRREGKIKLDRARIESLGWVLAYFLTRADPGLAGLSRSPMSRAGEAAARLAAASGWSPVPPFPTAFELAAIEQRPTEQPDERALLCRAVVFIEPGLEVATEDSRWRTRLGEQSEPEEKFAELRAQIARMRRDGACVLDIVAASARWLPGCGEGRTALPRSSTPAFGIQVL